MAEKASIGRRNPKIDKTHWEKLENLNEYHINKPTVLCFGGNSCITDENANGICKIAQNLMGEKLSQNENEIFEYVDFLGAVYKTDWLNENIGEFSKDDLLNFTESIFYKLLVDENGGKLPTDDICKNLSQITLFSFCRGAKELNEMCGILANHLEKDLRVSKSDVKKILGSMMHISYSPDIKKGESLVPMVFALSGKDFYQGDLLESYDFKGKNIAIEKVKAGDKSQETANSIAIYASQLTNILIDEHFISMISRDDDWKAVMRRDNADCVSQMLGYALATSVVNSIENKNSNRFIHKMSLDKLETEIADIMHGFEKDSSGKENLNDEMGMW